MDALDRFWEQRVRPLSPAFAAADATDEQTHRNHTLITILGFGGLSMALVAAFILVLSLYFGTWLLTAWVFTVPLAIGILGGIVFYLIREIANRLEATSWIVGEARGLRWLRIPVEFSFDWRYKAWDGIGDVLMPIAWPGAWAAAALAGAVPWWTGALLYGSAAAVAVHAFVLRPVRRS